MLNAKEQGARSCKGMVACSRGKRNELGWSCPLAAAASPGLKETRGSVECNKRGGLGPRLARVFRRHKDWAGPRGQPEQQSQEYGLERVAADPGNPSEMPQGAQVAEDTARASKGQPEQATRAGIRCPLQGRDSACVAATKPQRHAGESQSFPNSER